jgi:hypothetical protein
MPATATHRAVRIIGDRTRTVDGELVMRLVIDLENHPAHYGSRQP